MFKDSSRCCFPFVKKYDQKLHSFYKAHSHCVLCVCMGVYYFMYSGLVENSVCDRRISFAIASAYENHTFLDKVFVHLICIYSNRDRENKGEKRAEKENGR